MEKLDPTCRWETRQMGHPEMRKSKTPKQIPHCVRDNRLPARGTRLASG